MSHASGAPDYDICNFLALCPVSFRRRRLPISVFRLGDDFLPLMTQAPMPITVDNGRIYANLGTAE
ncbi:MAG TPA: hypothetical protein VIM43_02880 [Rugosibacter sp.]